MATITFRVMGIDDEKRIMNIIMQSVSREGKYLLQLKDNVDFYDLMANKLVSYKVLTRKLNKNFPEKSDEYEYNEGENFAKANLKGAYNFVEEEKKRLNPTYIMQKWNSLSNNALVAGIIGAITGSLLTWILTK